MYRSQKVDFDWLTLAKEEYDHEDHLGETILKDIDNLRNDPLVSIEAYNINGISKAKLEEVLDHISNIETQRDQAIKKAKECILNLWKARK